MSRPVRRGAGRGRRHDRGPTTQVGRVRRDHPHAPARLSKPIRSRPLALRRASIPLQRCLLHPGASYSPQLVPFESRRDAKVGLYIVPLAIGKLPGTAPSWAAVRRRWVARVMVMTMSYVVSGSAFSSGRRCCSQSGSLNAHPLTICWSVVFFSRVPARPPPTSPSPRSCRWRLSHGDRVLLLVGTGLGGVIERFSWSPRGDRSRERRCRRLLHRGGTDDWRRSGRGLHRCQRPPPVRFEEIAEPLSSTDGSDDEEKHPTTPAAAPVRAIPAIPACHLVHRLLVQAHADPYLELEVEALFSHWETARCQRAFARAAARRALGTRSVSPRARHGAIERAGPRSRTRPL